jgi:hypothetical protein
MSPVDKPMPDEPNEVDACRAAKKMGVIDPGNLRILDYIDDLREHCAKLEAELERDMHAYRGALGYPVPGWHDGKLSDGTTPINGLAKAVVKLRAEPAEAERDKLRALLMPPPSFQWDGFMEPPTKREETDK